MKHKVHIAILLLILATAATSEVPSNQFTHGHRNGRWWQHAAESDRTSYLSGYLDHGGYSSALDVPGWYFGYDQLKKDFVSLSVTDVSEALDRFYDKPPNLVVPLRAALGI